MQRSILARIEALERSIRHGPGLSFLLDDGGLLRVTNPIRYMFERGRRAPDGRGIVGLQANTTDYCDPLTASIIEALRARAKGKAPGVRETIERMERKREL